jgi:hypothetical protein
VTGAREAQGEAYSDASGDGNGEESVGESEGGSEAEADQEAALLDLLEAEGADCVGPRDGVWHSAFAGQRPTVAFSHAWHRELVAQDVARRRRGAERGTGEGGDGVGSEAAARREADGEEAAAAARRRRGALSMMRLKMTNNSSQVARMHEAAGITVQRAQGARGKASGHFNAWWAHPLGPSDKRWRLMQEHQRINHFPGTFLLGRKDRLSRCLGRFRRRAGRDQMNFYPRSFILPGAYADFKAAFAASKGLWIWKPQASARGIGIKLVTRLDQVSNPPPPQTCPVSTEGGTRRVQLVRKEGGDVSS